MKLYILIGVGKRAIYYLILDDFTNDSLCLGQLVSDISLIEEESFIELLRVI